MVVIFINITSISALLLNSDGRPKQQTKPLENKRNCNYKQFFLFHHSYSSLHNLFKFNDTIFKI